MPKCELVFESGGNLYNSKEIGMIVGCLRSIVFITLGFFLMGPMLCLAQSDADQYEYIDISNPFLRKIPLAVPFFKNVTGTGEEERLSKSSAERYGRRTRGGPPRPKQTAVISASAMCVAISRR